MDIKKFVINRRISWHHLFEYTCYCLYPKSEAQDVHHYYLRYYALIESKEQHRSFLDYPEEEYLYKVLATHHFILSLAVTKNAGFWLRDSGQEHQRYRGKGLFATQHIYAAFKTNNGAFIKEKNERYTELFLQSDIAESLIVYDQEADQKIFNHNYHTNSLKQETEHIHAELRRHTEEVLVRFKKSYRELSQSGLLNFLIEKDIVTDSYPTQDMQYLWYSIRNHEKRDDDF